MSIKPAPSITDSNFEIRTPGFIVVHGYVLHVMACQFNSVRFLKAGHYVRYIRHGEFYIRCVRSRRAFITHITVSGKVVNLLVPDEKWLVVSNGSYKTISPDYQSFKDTYSFLRQGEIASRM